MWIERCSPRASLLLLVVSGYVAAAVFCSAAARGDEKRDPPPQTADLPESWLVLYNLDNLESAVWADWYRDQWGIPLPNMLGLNASLAEHLPDQAAVQAQIIIPVQAYLAENPLIAQSVMGIVLGFGLPGHYARPPAAPSNGGFSIADALQDMSDEGKAPAGQKDSNLDNPHYYGCILPPGGRLTRSTMQPGKYMAARIDGPTLADAMALTMRAKLLSSPTATLAGQHIWFDYIDPVFPSPSHQWYWLNVAVHSAALAELPWMEFDLRGTAGPQEASSDAFRLDIYKLIGWSPSDFQTTESGSRVLGFDFNSFGAVTVRSTTTEGALFVPNALAAGYAAAIGATGEPQCCVGPFPDTVLAALREGWTLGEAFYLANPYNDWMWTLVGDPFLRLPNWFNEVDSAPCGGDINRDGQVDGLDIQPFVNVLTGLTTDPEQVAAADLDGDDWVDADDIYLFTFPSVFGSCDWDSIKGTGDANGDSMVDGADVDAFVGMVLHGTDDQPIRKRWAADMNKDGAVSVDDAPLFAEALLR